MVYIFIFQFVIKKDTDKDYQVALSKKSCFYLELDSKVKLEKLLSEKKNVSEYVIDDKSSYQSRHRVCLDMMGCYYRT